MPKISFMPLVLVRDGAVGQSSPDVPPIFLPFVRQVEVGLSPHLTYFLCAVGLSLDHVPFPDQSP